MRAQATVEQGACALYVSQGVSVRDKDIEAGFRWLETWDVLIPLKSYKQLAQDYAEHSNCDLRHEVCRHETEQAVKDMRQMVYDERVIFVRHGSSADDLLAARNDESCNDENCPLPLLRAIWKVKPLLLALPESWVQEETH